MGKLKLSEKDYQRGKDYINSIKNLTELKAYERQLKEWNYEESDHERLMALINAKRPEFEAVDNERIMRFENLAQEQNTVQLEQEPSSEIIYEYNLEKVKPYAKTPRSTETAFFKDCAGRAPFFGKEKWRTKYANLPLVYAAVVQANDWLWEPGVGFLPAVLLVAFDEEHRYNTEYLKSMAETLANYRDSVNVPDDCRNLVSKLRDEKSSFNYKVGSSVAGNSNAWCFTCMIDQRYLPHTCLSTEGVLPVFTMLEPNEKHIQYIQQIPAKYFD